MEPLETDTSPAGHRDPVAVESSRHTTEPGGPASIGETPTQDAPSGQRFHAFEELPPLVQLRAMHEGKWVAWSADRQSIVASSAQFKDLDREIKRTGFVDVIYEWIDLPYRQFNGLLRFNFLTRNRASLIPRAGSRS